MKKLSVLALLCITLIVLAGCSFIAPKGSVSGTVTDQSTGTPIEGVNVAIGELKATTDANGTYSIADVPAAEKDITATKEGYTNYTGKVLVEKGKVTQHNIVMVKADKGTVSGTITDKLTGQAIAGVQVTVGTAVVNSDAQGKYTVQIGIGDYELKAEKDGYDVIRVNVTVKKDEVTTKDLVMVSAVDGRVTGVVTEVSTQTPLKDATITLGNLTTTSDAQGKFFFDHVAVGEQDLKVQLPYYLEYTEKVTILAGKETAVEPVLTPAGVVKGYVTDGQGGPAVADATVTWGTYTTKTDAKGVFELSIPAGEAKDLVVTKAERASSKIQNVQVALGQKVEFNIPNRASFGPNDNHTAPTVTVEGVSAGQEISGTVAVKVKVSSVVPNYAIYVYVGGEQRSPRDLAIFDVQEGSLNVNTKLFPNGATYLRALVYDNNGNSSSFIVPVTINNAADDQAVPANLPSLKVLSLSFGQNIGFYSKGRLAEFSKYGLKNANIINANHGIRFDLNSAPAGATLMNKVSWGAAAGADGYAVYRSFDGENYSLLANVKNVTRSYDDFSPALEVMKKAYYKVVPYNHAGPSTGKVIEATLLPAYNVHLKTPANGAHGVSLTPTFTWDFHAEEGAFPEGTYYMSNLTVYDVTNYMVIDEQELDGTSWTFSGTPLKPMTPYSWDILSSSAEMDWVVVDGNNYSIALSVSGEYTADYVGTGSSNGEFVFTTLNPAK